MVWCLFGNINFFQNSAITEAELSNQKLWNIQDNTNSLTLVCSDWTILLEDHKRYYFYVFGF